MDFTLGLYRKLLETLISKRYSFFPLSDYISSKEEADNNSIIILRHDVDRLPQNSLRTAVIENSLGIRGTYYFRIVPESFNEKIIKEISALGHKIGYHYEDVDLANREFKLSGSHQGQDSSAAAKPEISEEQLIDLSYKSFRKNLDKLKSIANVKTICMHGSPLSKFDNKIIWKKYDYKNLGIMAEPYLDLNWSEFGYLTDTGRRWNGENVSVRDKVNSKGNFNFKSTFDIINGINMLPSKLMITVHPQRWNDNILKWSNELFMQSIKNVIKKYFFVK